MGGNFMIRNSIKRSGPPRKKRPGPPRAGRLEGEELDALRAACFQRDNFTCTYCNLTVYSDLPHEDPASAHMAHIQAKRRGGDNLSNVQTECGACHRAYHNFGKSRTKPCKSKREVASE
jgi:5-methylcytosine-specific restriction endonuclease McrA